MITLFKSHDEFEINNTHQCMAKKTHANKQIDYVNSKSRVKSLSSPNSSSPIKFMCMFIGN
jgi:hypothetical protein